MRFAAIADVHGNYLALEAVLADIRAQGIGEIVNLGDMASGPLDARRTMDALMALDAVHVLGNHDRYLIDRPPEKMGSWDRPAHAQLDEGISTGCARCRRRGSFATRCFSVMPRPRDEILLAGDGCRTARFAWRRWTRSRRRREGITQPLILCGHTHVARAVRLRDGRMIVNPGSVGSPGYRDTHPFPHVIEAGTPDARYAILELADGSGT